MPGLFSWRLIVYIILILSCDMTVAPLLQIGYGQFMLSYLFIAYVAFNWGWQKALPISFLIGLCRDFVSSQPFGVETFSLVFAAYLLHLIVQKMERSRIFLRMLVAFYFSVSAFMVNIICTLFVTESVKLTWHYMVVVLMSSFYTALLLPLFSYCSAKWFNEYLTSKQYELFS